jgi:peptidoglycan/xylan/chitin deacetylase (PgdA/CDA1 family)
MGSAPGAASHGPRALRARLAHLEARTIDRVLREMPYVSVAAPRKREIAPTFDDGPGPYTLRVVRVLGDHTEIHPRLDSLGCSAQQAQIDQQAAVLRAAGAPYPCLFRPPYGAFNVTTLSLLRQRHMLMVLWTVDSQDYRRRAGARRTDGGSLSAMATLILVEDLAAPAVVGRDRARAPRLRSGARGAPGRRGDRDAVAPLVRVSRRGAVVQPARAGW